MIVVYMLAGIVSGMIAVVAGLMAGLPLWSVMPLYAFGGMLAVLAMAGCVFMLPQGPGALRTERPAAADSAGICCGEVTELSFAQS